MKIEFLDLGKQPIANNFLDDVEQFESEYFYSLRICYDDETHLVSLAEFVSPEQMFHDGYVYHASLSRTMRDHFKNAALDIQQNFNPKKVLEIGSNDGVFLRHFSSSSTIAVEPCGNFADMTNKLGYRTYSEFWTSSFANKLIHDEEKRDVVFAANCMSHIQDLSDAFSGVRNVLSSNGVFIFEDPSLLRVIERNSYDQCYGAHAHIFSVTALSKILNEQNLRIFRVENLDVHGGSNRIFACKKECTKFPVEDSVIENLKLEKSLGLNNFSTYQAFGLRVKKSKQQLVTLLKNLKTKNKKIVSYGATAKSTTVFNYCNIGPDIIDCIVDVTPSKQNKFSPGMHIPVISPERGFDKTVNYAFLGAWNYEEEICEKENAFLQEGGQFISHIPHVRIIEAK
ncbi:SAM-dependent methyltransferase [archaeon]|nr:SAM-dependent methyltransferase [archaeon]